MTSTVESVKSVSIIIPAFNEAENIEVLISQLAANAGVAIMLPAMAAATATGFMRFMCIFSPLDRC
jgi:hypothetical protein